MCECVCVCVCVCVCQIACEHVAEAEQFCCTSARIHILVVVGAGKQKNNPTARNHRRAESFFML